MTQLSPWTWNKDRVKEWASTEFGIPIAEVFEENDVDGGLLLTEVNEEVLRESLFIESWGMRKRILLAINGLLQKFPTSSAVNEDVGTSNERAANGLVLETPKVHRVQATRPQLLSAEEIYQFLDTYMKTELIPKWENEKKPVLEQSAARFWMKHRSTRRKFIRKTEASYTYILRYRLPRICEALVHAGLTRTSDLRRMSLSLETAIFDARKLMWQIEILNGDRPETKDVLIYKPETVRHVVEDAESSDESLKSESELTLDEDSDDISDGEAVTMGTSEDDDFDDFIEYDDEPPKSIFDYGVTETSSSISEYDNTELSEDRNVSESDSVKDTDDSENNPDAGSYVNRPRKHIRSKSSKRRSRHLESSHNNKRHKRSHSTSEEREEESPHSNMVPFESDSDDDHFSDMNGSNYRSILDLNQPYRRRSTSTSSNSSTDELISLDLRDFPKLIKAVLQTSDTQFINAYNELKVEDPKNIHSDDKAIMSEIEFGLSLFAKMNVGNEEYQDFDEQGRLLAFIQHIIELEAASVPKTRSRRRLRRRHRAYSDSSESDIELDSADDVPLSETTDEANNGEGDEEIEVAESRESSQTGQNQKPKKGFFRKIRDETAQVSAVQSSWKRKLQEAEDRAEAQLQTLDETTENVIVNIGDADTAKHVKLLPHLAQVMKPHQIEGIRFMWRQTMMLKTGGVLGHAMGLGKTLQVIAFVYTIFQEIAANNKDLPDLVKPGRILILAPITTLKNWHNEFNKWIPRSKRRLIRDVINLAEMKFMPSKQRYGLIEEWYNKGGVLLMGYDNFRSCVKHAQNQDVFQWLQKPGPSLAIIDEGHKIKNAKSQLSNVVKNFETPFRLCMTGYPLQNNLEEYYCMIDFIYPGFLGTIGEFRNAYKNPIEHFYEDTTPADMMISKRQLYKLRRLLGDLIHRRDAEILHKELQRKIEFDVCCKLTEEQRQIYEMCVEDLRAAYKLQPLQALQVFRNICNHPAAFLQQTRIAQQAASQKRVENTRGNTLLSMFKHGTDENAQDASSNGSILHHRVAVDTVETETTSTHIRSPPYLSPSIDTRNSPTINSPGSHRDGLNEAGVAVADTTSPKAMEQNNTPSPSYTPHSPIMPYQPSFDRYKFSASGSTSQQSSMPLSSQPAVDDSSTQAMSNLTTLVDDEETALPDEYKTLFSNASALVQSMSDIHSIELSCKCKVALQIVQQCIEAGDKTLLFSHTIPTLDFLEKTLKDANIHTLRIDGSTPTPTRQIYVDKFNRQHKWQVFLISSKAASLGINLVAANRVILFDLDWNPCHDEQAVARAYRFGQQKEVFVYRMQTFGTIEEHIFRLNVHKHGISSRVVDDKTLMPQKQDLKKKYYLKPVPSPALPLPEGMYSHLTDPVLRATAEICREDLVNIELHSTYTSEYEQEGLNEQDKKEIEQQLSFEQRIRNGEIIPSTVPSMSTTSTTVPIRRAYDMHPSASAPGVTTPNNKDISTPGSSKSAPIDLDDANSDRPSGTQIRESISPVASQHSPALATGTNVHEATYTGSYGSEKESDFIYLPALGASDMLDYPDDYRSSQSQSIEQLSRDYSQFYDSITEVQGRNTTTRDSPQHNLTNEHQRRPFVQNERPSQGYPRRPLPFHWQTGVALSNLNSVPEAQPAKQASSNQGNYQMSQKKLSLANAPKSYLNPSSNNQ